MSRLSPRPDRKNLKPGDVVRLPRRMIDAVLRAGSDDRVVIREVHPRVVFVQSLANPWAAWYVLKTRIAANSSSYHLR